MKPMQHMLVALQNEKLCSYNILIL